MKKYSFLFLIMAFAATGSAQQTGTVGGSVLDASTNERLAGVSISWNARKGVVSDIDGRYSISLPPGNYSITYAFVGYDAKTIDGVVVTANKVAEVNVLLEYSAKELSVVTISASGKKGSAASLLSVQKNNAAISDGLSAESIRRSPDRNVGEALKRVSGTSIRDDKFVVVRGLSDRYNLAIVNGALLPATEPDRKAFSFDVIPADLIDDILINKTATPDLPGDFAGGIVQVSTKNIPYSNFFTLSAGAGFNTQSTGKDFRIGLLEKTDYLGFDNGTRAFPSAFPSTNAYLQYNNDVDPTRRLTASRLMRNNYGDRYNGVALPSMNLSMSLGRKKDLRHGGKIGAVAALTYRNTQNIQYATRRDYQTEDKTSITPQNLFFSYNDTTYSFHTSLGLLANVGYTRGNTKIVLRNLFNQVFENTNLVRKGFNYDNLQYVESTGAIAISRSLVSSQLEAEHKLSQRNDRLKYKIDYAFTKRDQPDYRVLPYAVNIDRLNDKQADFKVVLRDTYRFWSNLTEQAGGASADYSLPLSIGKERVTFKAGLLGRHTFRQFSTRIFRYENASPNTENELHAYPPEKIFNDGNIYPNGFVLNEITNNTDKYSAASGQYAGYLMMDGRLHEKWRAIFGLRVENVDFTVNTSDFSMQKVKVQRNYLDFLPSLNLTYSPSGQTNLRFAASRTVGRPEFREVANFAYFDFIRNAQLKGNTDLERSRNTNLDLRFETYPSAEEIMSVSVFYKHFDKPIEQVVLNGSSPSNLILSYTNPNAAESFGVEMEIRRTLDFIGASSFFEHFLVSLNASLIGSEVSFRKDNNPYDAGRPLQGQSPYLLNGGLQYTSASERFSASVLYNRIGQRISAVGFQGYPDIYENARSVVDLQVAFKVLREKGEIKLNVSDIGNRPAVFYQNVGTGNKSAYSSRNDRILYSYHYGSDLSFSFSYRF